MICLKKLHLILLCPKFCAPNLAEAISTVQQVQTRAPHLRCEKLPRSKAKKQQDSGAGIEASRSLA